MVGQSRWTVLDITMDLTYNNRAVIMMNVGYNADLDGENNLNYKSLQTCRGTSNTNNSTRFTPIPVHPRLLVMQCMSLSIGIVGGLPSFLLAVS